MNDDKVMDAIRKNPGCGRVKIMKITGCSESVAKRLLKKDNAGNMPEIVPQGCKRKTLADFRATYDKSTIVPAKIKAGIKALTKHGWEYEVQFAKEIGVSLADLANFRELFTDYFILLREGRRVWVGSVETAKQMKEMI